MVTAFGGGMAPPIKNPMLLMKSLKLMAGLE
jgi:hypothetical protein